MSFVIDGNDNILFQTFSGLKTSIASRLDRTFEDSDLNDFIYLAGLELERVLTVPYREAVDTLNVNAQAIDLPGDFKALRRMTLQSDPKRNLQQVPPAVLDSSWPGSDSGIPEAFAIIADQAWFAPVPDGTYTAQIVYEQRIVPLSDATPSNWVLDMHPDAYFYGALVQAADFIGDQSRIGLYRQAFDNVVDQINREGLRHRYSAAPLRLRSPVVA